MNNSSLINTRLGKYEIQAEIGRGGMGAVYRGYDPLLDRCVAVKVMAPHLVWQEDFVERFLREARAAARIRHPNIVTIHDVGQQAGWYYFVMEYLEGQTLTELVSKRGPLAPDEVLAILRPLAAALDYAHHGGLVHRDIKPANIIIGPRNQVTLTDFGIARAAQETRMTSAGTIVGTPEYMSPEQAQGLTADARSDQYSLAVVAYEMLSGQVPFEADSNLALMYKVVHETPPPICQVRPDLPPGVEVVLEQALAKEPGARYASVTKLVEALERALKGEYVPEKPAQPIIVPQPEETPTVIMDSDQPAPPVPVPAPPPSPIPVRRPSPVPEAAKPPERQRRGLWVGIVGSLAALALLIAGGVLVFGGGGDETTPTPQSIKDTIAPTITVGTMEEELQALSSPSPTTTHTPTRTSTRTPTRTPTRTRTKTPTFTPTPMAPTSTPIPPTSPPPTQPPPTQLPTQPPPTQPPPTQPPPTQPPPTQPPPTQPPPTLPPPTNPPPTNPPP